MVTIKVVNTHQHGSAGHVIIEPSGTKSGPLVSMTLVADDPLWGKVVAHMTPAEARDVLTALADTLPVSESALSMPA